MGLRSSRGLTSSNRVTTRPPYRCCSRSTRKFCAPCERSGHPSPTGRRGVDRAGHGRHRPGRHRPAAAHDVPAAPQPVRVRRGLRCRRRVPPLPSGDGRSAIECRTSGATSWSSSVRQRQISLHNDDVLGEFGPGSYCRSCRSAATRARRRLLHRAFPGCQAVEQPTGGVGLLGTQSSNDLFDIDRRGRRYPTGRTQPGDTFDCRPASEKVDQDRRVEDVHHPARGGSYRRCSRTQAAGSSSQSCP